MKANKTPREEDVRRNGAFTFIVPMTMAIVVGFALLIIGAYVVGTIGSSLEDSFPDSPSTLEQKTINLMGNVTDGFGDVVDIEIVVIIITALSMAILSIMAVGSKQTLF